MFQLFNISNAALKQLESDVQFMRDVTRMRAEYEGIEYGLIGLGAAILVCLCIIALVVCARREQARRRGVRDRALSSVCTPKCSAVQLFEMILLQSLCLVSFLEGAGSLY